MKQELKEYVTTGAVTFGRGTILVLTSAQAKLRVNNLKLVEEGGNDIAAYEVTGEVQFKRGETIGVVGPVPKALLQSLEGELVGGVDGEGHVVELESMKKAELLKMAVDADIQGAEEMSKAQLIEAIRANQAGGQ